jgi:cobalt-zinc-cadmium efflux system protein
MGDESDHLRAFARENRRQLLWVVTAGSTIAAIEFIGGFAAHSLVLLADAGHYLTDLTAMGLALFAVTWASRPADSAHSFGHGRGEVIAAFVNALVLWGLAAIFVVEGYLRLRSPVPVQGPVVLIVGALSLVANLAIARVLRARGQSNINIRAAYLHILSDVLGSLGAVVAGALIWFGGIQIADPVATLFVAGLIGVFAFRLSRDTLNILLEGTPTHIDPEEVERSLTDLPSVRSVHDLHVWTLTSGQEAMSVHLVLEAEPKDDRVTHVAQDVVRQRFRIRHATIQVEAPDCTCGGQPH